MNKVLFLVTVLIASTLIFSCNTLKTLQTNTTGGLFSLNGTWRMSSTTDGSSLVGTTIAVYPVIADARVKTLQNNTYCIKENDELWKNVKANGTNGFSLSVLVNGCNGSTVYNAGTVAIVDNNKITITTRTAGNSELIQAWDRVK